MISQKKRSQTTENLTLKKIANNIYPDWSLADWFHWPPNMFALIAMVLQRTGAYRICLQQTKWWEKKTWQQNVSEGAGLWIEYSNSLILNKKMGRPFNNKNSKEFAEAYAIIEHNWNTINLNELRIISNINDNYNKPNADPNYNKNIIGFTIALLKILAAADYCCSGLGLVGQVTKQPKHLKLFHAVANLLLNNTGSLSTIPKFYGTVLPKMRTPQSGMTLRSLSHHLTFHVTEVEVMWRTFPWLNNHKQSLNILAIPYPTRVDEGDFGIVKEAYHPVRYFNAKISQKRNENMLNAIALRVKNSSDKNNEIDIVVFPETSLTRAEYNTLLEKLEIVYDSKEGIKHIKLPLIIAGVKSRQDSLDLNASEAITESEIFNNELRMAIFFAGKWYEITQRKHHRWNLDRDQILQYKLEGYFSTERTWFEHSSISQRRLSILAPNGWLALTSLICEDLARQEPAGEVIRGIGPTLLFALLSDGPQLTDRWSARYASVLADDPGTAVLSLTSEGMVNRSQKIDIQNQETIDPKKNMQTIGLWKDMIKGWKELQINTDEKPKGLLFTVSATFKEEFTLDGRSDYTNASVFRMDTIKPIQVVLHEEDIKIGKSDGTNNELGTWDDIRELSGAFFSIDAIIDLLQDYKTNKRYKKSNDLKKNIKDSVQIILDLLQTQKPENQKLNFWVKIKDNINFSWENPDNVGIEAEIKTKNNHMEQFVAEVALLTTEIYNSEKEITHGFSYFELLISFCKERLLKIEPQVKDERDISKVTILAFLNSIHTKLLYCRYIKNMNAKGGVSIEEAQTLIKSIEDILRNF